MKPKSTKLHHLIVAVLSTVFLAYFIGLVCVQEFPAGSMSYSLQPDRYGSHFTVVTPLYGIFALAFCGYFSWRGFLEDRRAERNPAAEENSSRGGNKLKKPHRHPQKRPAIKPPPAMIDGARVVEWAWSGAHPFGSVAGAGCAEVFGLAIARYDNLQIYRFSCDSRWHPLEDAIYNSIEEAKAQLPDSYRNAPACWISSSADPT